MILATFGNAVKIQQEQLQNAQNTYQVKDKDHVNILSDFFSKFLLKKLEKFGVEKPIFSDGGGNPPPLVLKGLNETYEHNHHLSQPDLQDRDKLHFALFLQY